MNQERFVILDYLCQAVQGYYVLCRTVSKSVEISERVPMIMAIKGEFLALLRRITECSLKVSGNNLVSPSYLTGFHLDID